MKVFKLPLLQIAFVVFVAWEGLAREAEPSQICRTVGRLLEQGHYSRHPLDEEISRHFLRNYLDELDRDHLFFSRTDIAQFEAAHASKLGAAVLAGRLDSAYAIADRYRKRVEERVQRIKALLKEPFDFSSERTAEVSRAHSLWPADETEADGLWHDQIENELLTEKLSGHSLEESIRLVAKRYGETLVQTRAQTRADITATFLYVLAQTYDPHSEYLTKEDLEDFDNEMRLSMVGIGAVLTADDGYVRVVDLVAGGPAKSGGQLKVNDRVIAIAQGRGKFVDIAGMSFSSILGLIRGKEGTLVRLQVIPAHASNPSERKVIEIARREIRLKDEEAKAEIVERDTGGARTDRLGWITLPSFYGDPETRKGRSATRDVRALLRRLKSEGISGLVFDLRENGGGLLDEAVSLTGLFINPGPVVQARERDGRIQVLRSESEKVYDGPIVVLTDRLTASAAEIFAAALQDYGRAVIAGGGSTFGKGSVQTVYELNEFLPRANRGATNAGALDVTVAKYYRVGGGSTQLRGVIPDIRLPSPNDLPDIGENTMKNPVPYDEIAPAAFRKIAARSLVLPDLSARSAARVAAEPEFEFLIEDIKRERQSQADNRISLNEVVRRAQMRASEEREASRNATRSAVIRLAEKDYRLTLDDIRSKKLPASAQSALARPLGNGGAPAIDPLREEALNILSDLIRLTTLPESPRRAKK